MFVCLLTYQNVIIKFTLLTLDGKMSRAIFLRAHNCQLTTQILNDLISHTVTQCRDRQETIAGSRDSACDVMN